MRISSNTINFRNVKNIQREKFHMNINAKERKIDCHSVSESIYLGNDINAGAIKNFTLRVMLENSLKISRTFVKVHFERTFKYHSHVA